MRVDGPDSRLSSPCRRLSIGADSKQTTRQAFPNLGAAHFELPLSPVISRSNDRGTPVVVADPLSQEAEVCIRTCVCVGFGC